ncbi:MAG: hypothetical protein WCE44_03540 [Candidatus Velthaea sp.]|jgi:hypothetical protein
MTLGIPLLCCLLFLAFSSVAVFAPRRLPPSAGAVAFPVDLESAPSAGNGVSWPARLDARACGADADLRIALAGELAACRGAWAHELLQAALAEETDPRVRPALADALARRVTPP